MASLMANGSLRSVINPAPAGNFPTRNRGHPDHDPTRESGRPRRGLAISAGALPHLEEVESPKRWPTHLDGIDVITLTFAVVLAAAVLFLLTQLVPQLADLMMPPPLSGS